MVAAGDRLDVAGEEVDALDDEHVVEPAVHALQADRGASAAAGLRGERDDVAGAEADHRAGGLLEGGEHQLAPGAFFHRLVGAGVEHFDEDVVLGPVQAVLLLAHAGAGAEDVRQAVVVIHRGAPQGLDALAGLGDRAAGLAGHEDALHRQVAARVDAFLEGRLAQVPGVGRRRPDRRHLKLPQDRQQPLGRHRAGVDRQRAELLGAQHAGPADEQREVERVGVAVLRAQAGRPELARLVVDPVVEVGGAEGRRGGHAGGAAGGRDVDDVPLGHRDQVAEGLDGLLAFAQGLLGDEREAADVVEAAHAVGMHAGRVEAGPVVGRVGVGVGEVLLQQLQLEGVPVGAGLGLEGGVPVGAVWRGHGGSLPAGPCGPGRRAYCR